MLGYLRDFFPGIYGCSGTFQERQGLLAINVHSRVPEHIQRGLMYLAQLVLGKDLQLTQLQVTITPYTR
jgi:hypothetical protein